MSVKKFEAWEQVRNWCQRNPGKKAAVVSPEGTFTLIWCPTEAAADASTRFPQSVFSPLRGSEPAGSPSPHYETDLCGCTFIAEVQIGTVTFERRLVRACRRHGSEAFTDYYMKRAIKNPMNRARSARGSEAGGVREGSYGRSMTPDIHGETVTNNPRFHALMDVTCGREWREWDWEKKRAAAKVFNYSRLYASDKQTLLWAMKNG